MSSLLHLAGAAFFLIITPALIREGSGRRSHRLSLFIFSFACSGLLLISGMYHMLPLHSSVRSVFQSLDRSAIFILIAATFTPIHVLLLRGTLGSGILCLVWGLAVVGIALTTIFHTAIPEWVSLVFYLGLGWLGMFSAMSLWRRYGFALIKPLIYGGLFYTFGSVLEFLRTPIIVQHFFGPHELFHVAVLGGISFHWLMIRRCVAVANHSKLTAQE